MTTIKAYSDLLQSKKLAEILPLESADMHYVLIDTDENKYDAGLDKYIGILPHYPCWSLAALIEQMPSNIKGHELTIRKSYWQVEKTYVWELSYEEYFDDYPPSILVSTSSIDLIDACYGMVINLHELNLL